MDGDYRESERITEISVFCVSSERTLAFGGFVVVVVVDIMVPPLFVIIHVHISTEMRTETAGRLGCL